jgi:hypothetical protein
MIGTKRSREHTPPSRISLAEPVEAKEIISKSSDISSHLSRGVEEFFG